MSEFYNVNEHNHIDWSNDRLDERVLILSTSLKEIRHCPERLEQIKRELGFLAFETWCRYEGGEYGE